MPTTTRTTRYSATGTDEIDARLDEVRATMGRLRRATGESAGIGGSTLARKVAKFSPSGDVDADRAALETFERQAATLLLRGKRQRRDSDRRQVTGSGARLGSR